MQNELKTCVVLVAHNEEDGIKNFIEEIFEDFQTPIHMLVIDDCSTDDTNAIIIDLSKTYPITLLRNDTNLGHGRSVTRGWKESLIQGFDIIVTSDGDGQILGVDLYRLWKFTVEGKFDVVEGIRRARNDPFFRKLVTNILALIVTCVSRNKVKDSNTPFRVFTRESLSKVSKAVPMEFLTPNLYAGVVSRRMKLRIGLLAVNSLPRRSSESTGTMWKSKAPRWLPNKRFVQFCISALKQWAKVWRT